MPNDIKRIGIIGTGLVGAGWAAFYAGRGFQVNLYDADPLVTQSGYQKALAYLAFLNNHDLIDESAYQQGASRLTVSDTLIDAVCKADFVHESASERYEVKKEIFREVDSYSLPDAIIASSSSALLMTEIQKDLQHVLFYISYN